MPVYDEYPIWSANTTDFNITYTSGTTVIPVSQPFVAVPVTPIPPPVDDSPLVWLREQVAEVCELAKAA